MSMHERVAEPEDLGNQRHMTHGRDAVTIQQRADVTRADGNFPKAVTHWCLPIGI